MALQKQVIVHPFTAGTSDKIDPKAPVAGLSVLENAIFTSPGRIRKRNGFAALSRRVATKFGTAHDNLTEASALATLNDELLLATPTELLSWNDAADNWTNRGNFNSCRVTVAPVIRDTYQQTQPDGATAPDAGVEAYAWEDTRGGVWYAVIDSETGQVVVPYRQLDANGTKPRVLVQENRFLFYWYRTTDTKLYVATLPCSAPATALTGTAITTATTDANSVNDTYRDFAVEVMDPTQCIYLAFVNRTTPITITVRKYNPWNLTTADAQDTQAITAISIPKGVALFADPFFGAPVLLWCDTIGGMQLMAWDFTLATKLTPGGTPVTIDVAVTGATNAPLFGGVGLSSSALSLSVWYTDRDPASSWNYITRAVPITGVTYTVGTAVAMRSLGLAGKPFVYESAAWAPLVHDNTLQDTYFLADSAGRTVAKILYANGGGTPSASTGGPHLPGVWSAGGSKFRWAALRKENLASDGNNLFTNTGVVAVTADFADATNGFLRAEHGQQLHFGGGFIQSYDGAAVAELGFHLFPEPVTGALAAGGTLAAGVYGYKVCYEWTDNAGQIHRSAPSVALSKTATLNQKCTLTIATLRVTNKATPVNCVVYQTVADGSSYYRLGSVANSTTADTVSFVDTTTTDAVLQGKPQLYTTGSVVENIAPGPVSSVAVHRNRLVAVDTETPHRLWYSKEVTPGSPVEFSDSFILNIDPRGGAVTGIASMDDKLVVFKATSIFVVTGRGPASNATQDDFSDAMLVTTDCGCRNPRSIATVPQGLVFQSQKGIYLLDRGLGVQYIGAPVESYNSRTIAATVLVPDANQIRFMASGGIVLMFDYSVGQWSVFTSLRSVDAVVWDGRHCFVTPEAIVMKEAPGTFTDNGSAIRLKAVTRWFQFAGMQGFQRIYKVMVLGDYLSAHDLTVGLAVDFDPAIIQTATVEPATVAAYGGDATYGSGSPYGGTFPAYQWRIFPSRQKCGAMQVTIQDVVDSTAGDSGEAMSLSALSFEVGLKPGAMRLPAAQSAG